MPHNGRREPTVSDKKHDRVNRVHEVLVLAGLDEGKTTLETLMQEFAGSEQRAQSSRDVGLDALILLLILRGLCDRICRKDLFCPSPRCNAEIKNISALLMHLEIKHELAEVCRRDLR
jgi:hypothetical protein